MEYSRLNISFMGYLEVLGLPLGVVAAVFEEGEAGGGGDSVAVPEGDIDEPHRVDLCHHSLANGEDQELPE